MAWGWANCYDDNIVCRIRIKSFLCPPTPNIQYSLESSVCSLLVLSCQNLTSPANIIIAEAIMAEVEITQQSGDDSAAESISLPSDTPSKSRHDNNLQTHEEIFDQHDFQIQQIFDNKHHDINFDDDDGTAASWGEESFGNSTIASYESLGNASLTELRSALIARRRRLLDEGSITRGHRRGTSLDGSLGSLSFASLTESLTSLTRRKKKKKKDKSKKDKKDKKVGNLGISHKKVIALH